MVHGMENPQNLCAQRYASVFVFRLGDTKCFESSKSLSQAKFQLLTCSSCLGVLPSVPSVTRVVACLPTQVPWNGPGVRQVPKHRWKQLAGRR